MQLTIREQRQIVTDLCSILVSAPQHTPWLLAEVEGPVAGAIAVDNLPCTNQMWISADVCGYLCVKEQTNKSLVGT